MDSAHAIETGTVAEITNLLRRYGRHEALKDVTLQIPRGSVFGLVGENGAGKTTLIRLMLGMLRPSSGSVRLFGHDPVTNPPAVLSKIGYLSEDRDLPDWMRIGELISYTRAFYPNWSDAFAQELLDTFGLDLNTKVKDLSRGQRAQAGLLVALAYRPEFLMLDEPSSGLDVVVRRDILSAIIRTVAEEGRTVLFSSHFLEEVERVADYVAMIHQGKLVLCGPLDDVKAQHQRLTLRFPSPQVAPPKFTGALYSDGSARDWSVVTWGPSEEALAAAKATGAEVTEVAAPSLEEIFVARVGKSRGILRED